MFGGTLQLTTAPEFLVGSGNCGAFAKSAGKATMALEEVLPNSLVAGSGSFPRDGAPSRGDSQRGPLLPHLLPLFPRRARSDPRGSGPGLAGGGPAGLPSRSVLHRDHGFLAPCVGRTARRSENPVEGPGKPQTQPAGRGAGAVLTFSACFPGTYVPQPSLTPWNPHRMILCASAQPRGGTRMGPQASAWGQGLPGDEDSDVANTRPRAGTQT